jgi:hypothetical protein
VTVLHAVDGKLKSAEGLIINILFPHAGFKNAVVPQEC